MSLPAFLPSFPEAVSDRHFCHRTEGWLFHAAHLLMIIARMMGNHPYFRIFMMGGFCLAMKIHRGVRARKPMQTRGVRYHVSEGKQTYTAHMAKPAHRSWLGCGLP